MRYGRIGVVAAVAAAAALAFFFRDRLVPLLPDEAEAFLAGAGEEQPRAPQAVPVGIAPVKVGTAELRFETSATVVAREAVTLTSEVGARVERIFVEDGARLAEGDPVLRFDDGSEEQAVEAAEAAVAEADADLGRSQRLFRENVAAEARVETARAAAQRARAELRAAEKALADRTVRAPFAGQIGFVEVSPGAVLDPGDPIASLQTTDDLRVRFGLPIRLAAEAGQIGAVELVSGEGTCASAEVVAVSPIGTAGTRSRLYEARLPGSCGIAPGAFRTVSAVIGKRPGALFVPHEAVVREGFEAHVFRVEDTGDGLVARRVPVRTGVFSDGRIEVREGLSREDRVVAEGVQKVSDGTPVTPAGGADG